MACCTNCLNASKHISGEDYGEAGGASSRQLPTPSSNFEALSSIEFKPRLLSVLTASICSLLGLLLIIKFSQHRHKVEPVQPRILYGFRVPACFLNKRTRGYFSTGPRHWTYLLVTQVCSRTRGLSQPS
jgi:hypothetical protein